MQQIRSIKQLASELARSRDQLKEKIDELCDPLTREEEQILKSVTLQQVIRNIPTEASLQAMLDNQQSHSFEFRSEAIRNYGGDYRLIKQAGDNAENLKQNASKIYYLASQIDLPKVQKFLDAIDPGSIRLKSYKICMENYCKQSRIERNMLCSTYLQKVKERENKELLVNQNDLLSEDSALISVNFYDSLNGQKQHEFVCLTDESLLDIANCFYCVMSQLEIEAQMKDENEPGRISDNSYFLIGDNFYYHGNALRKKLDEILSLNFPGNKRSFRYEMAKTSLNDLRIIFGRPYLFRHLSGCDHMVIFKDLRLFSKYSLTDLPRRSLYPMCVYESKMKKRRCEWCRTKFSTIVALGDEIKNGKAFYICESCKVHLYPIKIQGIQFVPYIHD